MGRVSEISVHAPASWEGKRQHWGVSEPEASGATWKILYNSLGIIKLQEAEHGSFCSSQNYSFLPSTTQFLLGRTWHGAMCAAPGIES